MSKRSEQVLFLSIPVHQSFIRLASVFVGKGTAGLGLHDEAAEEMALASEEIMAYLVRSSPSPGTVEIRCSSGSYYVQAHFCFGIDHLNVRSFNMTATIDPDDVSGMDGIELLIASRMADRFEISRRSDGTAELKLIREFSYAKISDETSPGPSWKLPSYTVVEPDSGQIKWFARQVVGSYPASVIPPDFYTPGKIIDMVAAGEYQLLVAVGPDGRIGGGVAWRAVSRETVELFGPHVFHHGDRPSMASDLLDACLGRVARTSALVLINRLPSPDLPDGYLEALGAIDTPGADGPRQRTTVSFREMHEDMGSVAWIHPELYDFIAQEYQRLYLPREIRQISAEGEAGEPFSVLSATMDRRLGTATLQPIWPGADCLKNLMSHVRLMEQEGLATVFFEMDLGVSWQAQFGPALLKTGFTPQLLLPHGGSGDLVIFGLTDSSS